MNNSNAIKRNIIVITWILLMFIIFLISVIHPFVSGTVKSIIGKPLWLLIYILLPIFTVIGFLLINKHLRWKKIFVYAVCMIIAYLMIVSLTSMSCYMYIQNFTTEKWSRYINERNLMLKDLENNYQLIGMTVNEVKEMLGNPDLESENEIEYVIGKGFIDPEMFVLKYNEQIVTDFYTYIEFKPESGHI